MDKMQISENDIVKMVSDAVSTLLNEDRFTKAFKKARLASRNSKRTDSDNISEWLKDPTTDCAAIAAQLWPSKNEDSRRSYFYKCRDHKTYTAHGKKRAYDFTRKERQKLFAIMTNKA